VIPCHALRHGFTTAWVAQQIEHLLHVILIDTNGVPDAATVFHVDTTCKCSSVECRTGFLQGSFRSSIGTPGGVLWQPICPEYATTKRLRVSLVL